LKERKLNLAEQGFGNHAMRVIAKIVKNNDQFSSLVKIITIYSTGST